MAYGHLCQSGNDIVCITLSHQVSMCFTGCKDLKSLASNGVPVRVRPWVFSGGLRFMRYVCCAFRALFFEGALVVY